MGKVFILRGFMDAKFYLVLELLKIGSLNFFKGTHLQLIKKTSNKTLKLAADSFLLSLLFSPLPSSPIIKRLCTKNIFILGVDESGLR